MIIRKTNLNSPETNRSENEWVDLHWSKWLIKYRIPILILVHVVIFSLGYFLAYALRLDFTISPEM